MGTAIYVLTAQAIYADLDYDPNMDLLGPFTADDSDVESI